MLLCLLIFNDSKLLQILLIYNIFIKKQTIYIKLLHKYVNYGTIVNR